MKRGTALALLLALTACGGGHATTVVGAKPATRVVALVPSLVEDVVAVGAARTLVGTSVFVDDVPAAKGLPRVADFDSVDAERIVALRPDLVVGIPSQARYIAPLRRAGIRVVLIRDDTYADIFSALREVGALTGHRREAERAIAALQARSARIVARTHAFVRHPSVFVALGTGPIWTVGRGSYIASLIALAGGRNAAVALDRPYGEYSAEALLRAQPDAIVTDPDVRLKDSLSREPWRSLRAVRAGHIYVVNPTAILARPGPRYVEGLAWLVARLTPLATKP